MNWLRSILNTNELKLKFFIESKRPCTQDTEKNSQEVGWQTNFKTSFLAPTRNELKTECKAGTKAERLVY